jgi:hypothetical protein
MKKTNSAILIALAILVISLTTAFAAPVPVGQQEEGPYNGIFFGWIYGDRDSKAPIALKLHHIGQEVTGRLYLGEGLYIDGGRCGSAAVPPTSVVASGTTDPMDPNALSATSTVDIGGFSVNIGLESMLEDETIQATAQADLPWICGTDPQVFAELNRVNPNQ